MGTTSRFALRYPEPGDENNVPLDINELATDVEGRLSRAFECTSSTRPTGIGSGFIIRETDTGAWLGYDGTIWVALSGGGGGGGGSSASYRAHAGTTAQSIPNNASTVVAFGTEADTDALVTRATSGAGHKFTLGASGIWVGSATIRYTANATAGEKSVGFWTIADDRNLCHDGGRREGLPATLNLSFAEQLASGTEVIVETFQATGGTRSLEPSDGAWVHVSFALVG